MENITAVKQALSMSTIFGVVAGLPIFGFMGIIFGPLLVSL